MWKTSYLFLLCLAIISAKLSNAEVSKEKLCQEILKGESRLFYHLFCSNQLPVDAPASPLRSTPSKTMTPAEMCEMLCNEGSGGAVCDCSGGSMPPAVKPPVPPKSGKATRNMTPNEMCDMLCNEGSGGAVCDCSGGSMPPAVKPPVPPKSGKAARSMTPSEMCDMLCNEGSGGAVCDCSGGSMPPAVQPPLSRQEETRKSFEERKQKSGKKILPIPLPPQGL